MQSTLSCSLQAGGAPSPAHAAAEAQLRDFLKQHVDVLDVGTTVSLLGAYGRLEDLLVYAQVMYPTGCR
jgi:hypothetical protein